MSLHGSNNYSTISANGHFLSKVTLQGALVAVLLCVPFTSAVGSEKLVMGGTGWSIGMARLLAAHYMKDHPEVLIEVPNSVGSGGGIKAVLSGRFDLSFAARPIKKKNQGKGLTATPFVKTPFVLAVSPVAGRNIEMTSADVLATYSGERPTWPNGTRITHVLRSERETDTKMLVAHFKGIELLLKKRRSARGALIAYTDQEAMDIGEKIPGTMVATTLLAMRSEKRALETISIDGVKPTLTNLDMGAWKMAITLYVVQGPKTNAAGQAFAAFLMSEESAKLLREIGGLPVGR
jgi:phosphate transport system substrate-binding protein